jgi:hypothetical protein
VSSCDVLSSRDLATVMPEPVVKRHANNGWICSYFHNPPAEPPDTSLYVEILPPKGAQVPDVMAQQICARFTTQMKGRIASGARVVKRIAPVPGFGTGSFAQSLTRTYDTETDVMYQATWPQSGHCVGVVFAGNNQGASFQTFLGLVRTLAARL